MKQKKGKNKPIKKSMKEQLSLALELPPEVVMDVPNITLIGKTEVSIENFAGILEYTSEKIRLNTKVGVLSIEGKQLEAKSMTSEVITIHGIILCVAFV